jgi:hypothetical protein
MILNKDNASTLYTPTLQHIALIEQSLSTYSYCISSAIIVHLSGFDCVIRPSLDFIPSLAVLEAA